MTNWSANEFVSYASNSALVTPEGIRINWYEVERFILFPFFLYGGYNAQAKLKTPNGIAWFEPKVKELDLDYEKCRTNAIRSTLARSKFMRDKSADKNESINIAMHIYNHSQWASSNKAKWHLKVNSQLKSNVKVINNKVDSWENWETVFTYIRDGAGLGLVVLTAPANGTALAVGTGLQATLKGTITFTESAGDTQSKLKAGALSAVGHIGFSILKAPPEMSKGKEVFLLALETTYDASVDYISGKELSDILIGAGTNVLIDGLGANAFKSLAKNDAFKNAQFPVKIKNMDSHKTAVAAVEKVSEFTAKKFAGAATSKIKTTIKNNSTRSSTNSKCISELRPPIAKNAAFKRAVKGLKYR